MDKDIQKLIERFMAGQTSIEEEDMLAEHFRNHKVADEWKAYKEMFAWFDKGMPSDDRKPMKKGRHQLLTALLTAAAAAATVLLTVITWSADNIKTAYTDKPAAITGKPVSQDVKADTAITDTAAITSPVQKPKKRRYRKGTYSITYPQTYIAQNEKDSISRIIDGKLEKMYKQQEEALREIQELHDRQNLSIAIMMAAAIEEAAEETEYNTYD